MRQALARPEQLPNTLNAFVNRALRDAALAPTYIDGFDVLADALLALATLAKSVEARA